MPIYEFECARCRTRFEELLKADARTERIGCPSCGSRKLRRLFSRFGFTSGSTVRTSTGGSGCGTCRPSPEKCGSCGRP